MRRRSDIDGYLNRFGTARCRRLEHSPAMARIGGRPSTVFRR
jgi:hypothetical protein